MKERLRKFMEGRYVTAVKNGDILNLQNNELSRPAPRLAAGAQMLFDFVAENEAAQQLAPAA